MAKVIVKRPGQDAELVEITGDLFDYIKDGVMGGEYVQRIGMQGHGNLGLWCDEMGAESHRPGYPLPLNFKIPVIKSLNYPDGLMSVRGPVVFTDVTAEGDIVGLDAEQVGKVLGWLALCWIGGAPQ